MASLGIPRAIYEGSASYSMWVPAPGVVVQRLAGRAEVDVAKAATGELDAVLRECSEITLFDDFDELVSFTAATRAWVVSWTRANIDKHRAIHVLVSSKLVSMGVTVASVALRGVRSYSERARFEAALATEIVHAKR